MKRMSLLLLLVVWFCQSVYAVTIGIPEDQSTIQEAVDAAGNGGTILVGDGVYQENISIWNKDLILLSENGPTGTVIDGSQSDRCVNISGSSIVEMKGFTLTNGLSNDGAGIKMDVDQPVLLDNLYIRGN